MAGRLTGHGNAVHALGDEVLYDLELFQLGMFTGADIFAGHIGQFVLRLVAPVPGQVEERVVHRLGHEGEGIGIIGQRGHR